MLSPRVRAIGLSPTLRISGLARELREAGEDVIDFSAGQPDFPTPEAAAAAGIRAIEDGQTRYTANEGLAELRDEIAAKLSREQGLDYGSDQIIVSPGAKASLAFAILTLFGEGDRVVVPAPYWVSYPEQLKLAGAEALVVDCPASAGFKLQPDALRRVARGARGLILNYPSNPTGACYGGEELRALAEVCLEHELWVLADEIYEKLLFDDRTFTSVAAVVPEMNERTLVINGASKAYAMTGWRIGWTAGPAEVIAGMRRLQSHVTSNASSVAQWAAVAALRDGAGELERRRLAFQQRRDVIAEVLSSIPGIRCSRPEGSFYIFPDVSGLFGRRGPGGTLSSGEDVAEHLLREAGVAVVPGEGFGAPHHVRFSFATSMERIEEGMRRTVGALAALER